MLCVAESGRTVGVHAYEIYIRPLL